MHTLYYGRHGETVDLANRVRSRPDTPLTEEGRRQARQAGSLLLAQRILPDLIVCSTLPRAIESAEEVAGEMGYSLADIKKLDILDERNCGIAVGLPRDEIKRRWPEGFDTVPGAETRIALQERAGRATEQLRALPHHVILVMGHGTIGRAIRREFESRPFSHEDDRRKWSNGEIVRLHPQPTTSLLAEI